MNIKRFFRKFVAYFSAKAKIERKEKIISYRTKKYAGFSKEQLKLEIDDMEDKEKTAKSIFTFLNIAVFSAVAGVLIYIFKQLSLWILAMHHVQSQKGISTEAIQFSKLVDVGLGTLLIVLLLLFLFWYNTRRNSKTLVLRALKKELKRMSQNEL
ncbi:hypothetical protein ABMS27_11880 [Lactiplantibacillus plantarum]|uniref:hypothetical protein n=1 Tax=Lactiplantibacillus plantarum TaxID=1590 RepID=UPI001F4BD3DA|nr:hypothetical protein [Lactiplantibacillus plantarum]UNB86163.1 hypothetical protein LXM95_07455 [Lactiplantibacillus plantarum]